MERVVADTLNDKRSLIDSINFDLMLVFPAPEGAARIMILCATV
jgi:hypothetical protein